MTTQTSALPNDLIGIAEAAELLAFNGQRPISGVYKMIERGALRSYRITDPDALLGERQLVSRVEVMRLRDVRRKQAEAAIKDAQETLSRLT